MELLETVGQRLPDVLLISLLGWCLYKALFEDLFAPRASRALRASRPPGALYMLYWRWRYRVLRFGQRRRYACGQAAPGAEEADTQTAAARLVRDAALDRA